MLGILLCVSLLLTVASLAGVNSRYMSQEANRDKPYRSPFRYTIVSNEIDGDPANPNDGYRYVEVLLDEKAFSENNLKELFRLISKRFPKPKVLHVQVYTNLEDVETPEEREGAKVSEAPYDPSLDKYHQAFFLRDNDGNEWFTYNPNPPSPDTKKIILRGRDPQAPRR